MTRSNPYRSVATQIFVGALAAAVLLFAPSAAFAQHGGGGGGHMGGGGGGGHFGGGGFGGGSHASAPAPSHSAPRPATHSAPVTQSRPPVVASAHTDSATTGAVIARPSLFGAPASSGPAAGLALHSDTVAPRTTVIGFPPSESHAWTSAPTHSGPMSFSGQGHDIWQDSSSRSTNNVVTNAPASANRSLFSSTNAPSTIIRPMPPHLGFQPQPRPIIYYPAYGYLGPYGYPGYAYGFGCDPFSAWRFNSGFGCSGFGYGFGYAGGFGFGGYYGSGFGWGSGPVNDDSSNTGYVSPDEGYGPYSSSNLSQQSLSDLSNANSSSDDSGSATAVTAAPDSTPAPAPPATTIWLKDGTSYEVMSYWLDAGNLHYITNYGGETSIDMSQLDLQRTVDENALRGANFSLRPAPASPAPAPNATPSPAPEAAPPPQQ